MKSAGQQREMSQFDGEQRGIIAAMVSCVARVLGLAMIAAAPWLFLYSDAAQIAAEQPAFQVARTFPSVAESKRIFDGRS